MNGIRLELMAIEVHSIRSDRPSGRIVDGCTITVRGRGFGTGGARLRIGEAIADVGPKTDAEIVMPLSSANLPSLRAGRLGVQVMRAQIASNVLSIDVAPAIMAAVVLAGVLQVTVTPAVGMDQVAEALLDLEGNVPEEVRLDAGSRQSVTRTLLFPITGVPSGRALIRVAIDGVQSPLELGPDNRYDRPSVVIP